MNTRYSDVSEPVVSRTFLTILSRHLLWPAMIVALGAYVFVHRGGPSPYFISKQGILLDSVISAAAVLTAIAAALTASAIVSGRFAGLRYERPLVYGLTAFAFVVVPAAFVGGIAGWTGVGLLRPPWGPLIVGTPALAVTAMAVRRGWRPMPLRVELEVPGGLQLTLMVIAVVLIGTSAILAFVRPPTGFDALSYHGPMAVYFWRDGNIVSLLDRAPWGFAMAHPGAAELWFGLLRTGFGERAANLGQLPFALLGAAAVRAFSCRLGFPQSVVNVAGLAFLIAPIVVIQAGIQVNDVVAAALLMSGIALACAPATSETPYRAAIVGLAAGLAVTVKLAVLPGAAALLAFVAIMRIRASLQDHRSITRYCLALAIAFGISVAPWAARNALRFGNPVFPAALPFLGRGVVVGDFVKKDTLFVPFVAAWPLYPLVEAHRDDSGLGPLFLVAAAPGLLLAAFRRRNRPLQLYAAVSATSLAAWWILTQHEPRHLLTVLGLAFGFLPWTLLQVPRKMRRGAVLVLIAAGVFSAVVTLDLGLAPRVGEPTDRVQFYDEIWGVDPFVSGRNEPEALLYNTGYANRSYAGDYPLLGPTLSRILLTVDTDVSTETIVDFMKRHGVHYAYVPASPAFQPVVEAKYTRDLFELTHVSIVETGPRAGTKRYLFHLRETSSTGEKRSGS
jgi:hypothetical protein